MGVALTIGWKEFRSFLNSPLAYIFVIIFLLYLNGTFFLIGTTRDGALVSFWNLTQADMKDFFSLVPAAFAILIPALSMKLWPDELKSGTIELLLSYPVRAWQIVIGKFLAGMYMIVIALVLTLFVPFMIGEYGNLDWGPILGSYIGALLMGGAFLSLGLFFGALFSEQVTAFIVTALICALVVAVGTIMTNLNLPSGLQSITDHLSFTARCNYLARGVVPLSDVLYFLLFGATFLVLNVTVIECRKGK